MSLRGGAADEATHRCRASLRFARNDTFYMSLRGGAADEAISSFAALHQLRFAMTLLYVIARRCSRRSNLIACRASLRLLAMTFICHCEEVQPTKQSHRFPLPRNDNGGLFQLFADGVNQLPDALVLHLHAYTVDHHPGTDIGYGI